MKLVHLNPVVFRTLNHLMKKKMDKKIHKINIGKRNNLNNKSKKKKKKKNFGMNPKKPKMSNYKTNLPIAKTSL